MPSPYAVSSLLLGLPLLALSYPDQVPDSACAWLAPWHKPYTEPAQGPAPFKLRTYHDRAVAGVPMPVCLVGARPFLGFMLQAQDEASGETLGAWEVPAASPAATMTCSKTNDTVTHSSGEHKQVVALSFLPPDDYNGTVVFKATVVTSYSTYYADITSRPFSVVSV
ncbi:putative defense protein Hdd11 [Eriocheir sinensis]|uniref:putative defense protein Hdd11 n=1 Tax=Eriocheir sinensis TaxID=95602 RepID=UPI0021C9ABA4|nr:putative defense protein Hdd11 [Eriocheir sinensis]